MTKGLWRQYSANYYDSSLEPGLVPLSETPIIARSQRGRLADGRYESAHESRERSNTKELSESRLKVLPRGAHVLSLLIVDAKCCAACGRLTGMSQLLSQEQEATLEGATRETKILMIKRGPVVSL